MTSELQNALQKRLEENYAAYAAQLTKKSFATLDKGKHKNNNKMDCQPYRKRRPATQKGGVFA